MVADLGTGDMVGHLSLSHNFGSASLSGDQGPLCPLVARASLALLLCGQQADSRKNWPGIYFSAPFPSPFHPSSSSPSLFSSLLPSLPSLLPSSLPPFFFSFPLNIYFLRPAFKQE